MTNSNPRVRVRFAPSPTGPLHMGGVRTALYNYLFAKKHGGDFILRIEDTDQGRFVPGAEDYIMEALRWCGIEPNEGLGFGDGPYAPYRQSERKEIFGTYAEQLVQSGHAYYAFDTPEEMDQLRKSAEAEKRTFSYDASTRMQLRNSLTLGLEKASQLIQEGVAYVIRLKVPPGEEVVIHDLIRGQVTFQSDVVDDKVLLKADGMPTYHLAHIVDDYLMKITHAVRGEEWLPSAPAHVLIYRFLGWENEMPLYAHLPLLLKPDGNGKLSKRDGDRLGFPVFPLNWSDPTSGEQSSGYRERGYLPNAFVNMLAFLGWNPGTEQEIFSLEELAHAFSFDHIHKAGARFDPEKAKWFNEQYLRSMPAEGIAKEILPDILTTFQIASDDRRVSPAFLHTAVEILKPRVQFAHEMITQGSYLFQAPTNYDQGVIDKRWKENSTAFFSALCAQFASVADWNKTHIEATVHATASEAGIKPGEMMQLLRVLVSGQPGGVDLMGMLELLGREEIIKRIELALDRIKK
ncbi:MAG: glutamate--tRNA ligase [Flavobacteriales bacterium]